MGGIWEREGGREEGGSERGAGRSAGETEGDRERGQRKGAGQGEGPRAPSPAALPPRRGTPSAPPAGGEAARRVLGR